MGEGEVDRPSGDNPVNSFHLGLSLKEKQNTTGLSPSWPEPSLAAGSVTW